MTILSCYHFFNNKLVSYKIVVIITFIIHSLGTVVRPYNADDNAAYDLDFICQVSNTDRDDIDAKGLRELIKSTFEGSELYGGKLEIYDECFTIKYADTNGIGFSIDIVPAVDESYQNKSALVKKLFSLN